ncbi:MAG: hypothetical protein Q7U02_03360 [Desulfosalsimonadaceae bacterium]|nr:hypothetical protein [Desulfosalsimonadaceae bacterium]
MGVSFLVSVSFQLKNPVNNPAYVAIDGIRSLFSLHFQQLTIAFSGGFINRKKTLLLELYENMRDAEAIEAFEKKEKRGKVSFLTADSILTEC